MENILKRRSIRKYENKLVDEENIKKILEAAMSAIIPIGYPAESKPPADRYNEQRIHMEKW